MNNPFLKYGYQGPSLFCDREEETKLVARTLSGGASNITLISPRRMGKTGLIRHVFENMHAENPQSVFIYVDALPTRSFKEFVQVFGENVLNALRNTHKTVFERTLDVLKSLRPVFSTDVITGSPTLTLTVVPDDAALTLHQILDLLETCGRNCFVAFDEFQQVGTFPDANAEALLRSRIQFLKNVRFIFAGSSLHMMMQMFMSAKRPFFNSTQMVSLKPIDEKKYYVWASHFFESRGDTFSAEVFSLAYALLEGHTWYMQAILNRLYETQQSVTALGQVKQALRSLVEENTDYYQSILTLLTDNQLKVLRAVAVEGKAQAVNSSEFIRRHNLKTSSSVNTAMKALIDKELIYHQSRTYQVYDRFLAVYLRSLPK